VRQGGGHFSAAFASLPGSRFAQAEITRKTKKANAMPRPPKYFRAGVGAVIANGRGRVLALERAGIRGAWQFPQGGLEDGEKPLDAVFREVEEETGITRNALKLVTRYPDLLAYELPVAAQSPKTGMGQVQYWFLFRTKEPAVDIHLPPHGEFRSSSWLPFDCVLSGVVNFKRPIYQKLRTHFRKYLHPKN
jgi:putative (di)nucleoside polyphosphate hydrolase